jgi:hypothetical protein
MTKQEFLNLNEEEKLKFLNSEAAAGKGLAEILEELSLTKAELGRIGYYWVGNNFMGKPMKGYGTTKRSGNEKTE